MNTNAKRLTIASGAIALAAVIGLGSLTNVAFADNSNQTVPLEGAKSAKVEIRLNAGELHIEGGAAATDLSSGSFSYEASNGEPKIEYSVDNEAGTLKVESEGNGIHIRWPWDMLDSTQWDVKLNNSIPTDLKVDVNAGTLDLALGGTNVTNLDVDIDAAKATVDLSGGWTHNLEATLEADAGQLVVIIPDGVGVRVESDVDAGDTAIEASSLHETEDNVYVNDAYATATVKLNNKAVVDAGQLKVKSA